MILSFSTLIIRGLERNEISIQSVEKNFSAKWKFNFDTAAHIELIGFKEYYGMPRGHEHDPIYSLRIYAHFFGPIFL